MKIVDSVLKIVLKQEDQAYYYKMSKGLIAISKVIHVKVNEEA